MKSFITKISRATKAHSMVVLIHPGDKIKTPLLSAAETEFVNGKISGKDTQVAVNQLDRWVFVQIIPEKFKGARLLEELRKSANILHGQVVSQKIEKLAIEYSGKERWVVLAFAEGLALSNYQFLKYFTKPGDKAYSLKEIALTGNSVEREEADELNVLVEAVYRTRDLINEPNSYLTATRLAREIQSMGQDAGFSVEVFGKNRIKALKMGGLLAVNQGSVEPPAFSILEWKPANAVNKKPLVLVGKGIVYDSGGLSLKPTTDSMDYMKSDMSGAAAVAGLFYALARNKVPYHVIGLIPSTDNRPSGNAYAPGDVITMYDGTTVEMLNADAEGRMILADALAYAKKYKPQLTITIATLTGAAARAIGKYGIVSMGNASRKVMDDLKQSGENVYERLAEMPFWEEYAEMIKSEIADIQNIGGADAGAITAGKFLEYFTDYPFIHLDIAGVAFLKKGDSYRGKGGTGVGVRIFYDYIKTQAKQK